MLRTRVGYAGGTTKNPTYRSIGDHTEVFQVDYDPKQISFDRLLDEFWANHNPCSGSWSTQYKAILFYNDAAELAVAKASAKKLELRLGKPVTTELKKLDTFYFAEDYHQKYSLRRHRALFESIRTMFDSERAFAESTVAARVNAYLDRHLSFTALQTELAKIGLRAVGERKLERVELAQRDAGQAKSTTESASKPTTKPESRPTSRPTAR